MARAGLGPGWSCLFANDIDPKKASTYAQNWGAENLKVEDVSNLKSSDLPGTADLAWASFPCQDLSLAGSGAGLSGKRSGTFWPFWNLITDLSKEGRAPPIIVLENVRGALTSHDGKDFTAIGSKISHTGYRFGALVIDAVHFVPQSRPRLFIVAIDENYPIPNQLTEHRPQEITFYKTLRKAFTRLPSDVAGKWVWWKLPLPSGRNTLLSDIIEDEPKAVEWNSFEYTQKILSLMSPINLEKVEKAKRARSRRIGTIYKRTRPDGKGGKIQRAEIRFDDIAGCLRTPAGGSSRQTIMVVEDGMIRTRLLSPREAARLMGLPDDYQLPCKYNDAYHLAGDGVVVPVVRHLSEQILESLLAVVMSNQEEAA